MMQYMYYIYIPILILLVLILIMSLIMYSNRQIIKELEDDSLQNEVVIKNMINAITYNDKNLHENQKYIYKVYEENNNFNDLSAEDEKDVEKEVEKEDDVVKNVQYYNMMKNYDALTNLI